MHYPLFIKDVWRPTIKGVATTLFSSSNTLPGVPAS